MDTLRSMYQELYFIKIDIRRILIKLRGKQEIPKDELRGWLLHVCNIRDMVNEMETLLTLEMTRRRFSAGEVIDWLCCVREIKKLVNEERILDLKEFVCIDFTHPPFLMQHLNLLRLSEKVNQLFQITPLANEIFADFRIVSNFRDRSQLLETIWGGLMDPKIGINSIYGPAGVGKTTAMRKIYDQLTVSDIFDKIVWVTFSKELLSLHKLQSDIALQMSLDIRMYEDVQFRAAQLLKRLKKTKKLLIIIDNMCQQISLEEVGIPQPETEHGCKIVLITRSLHICKYMKSNIIVTVEALYAEEAWNLFISKVGDVVYVPEIQTFAKQVVKHCRGLPIGIVSVGHAMRGEVNVEMWRKAFQYINTQEDFAMEGYMFKLLRYGYNRLNNDKAQNCFLYCAFFAADYLFRPEEIIRYWMAENFIYEAGDIVAEIDEGFMILRKLQDANMLQMFTEGGEVFLRMHDLFRDLAISIMKEKPGFSVKAGLGLSMQPSHTEWDRARKISFMRNSIQTLNVVPYNCPHISTLLLSDNPISHIASSFFYEMLTLEFLDLSYSFIIELPTSLSKLSQLHVLFLQYCTRLERIPSLKKMTKLQSLCLCGTSITELPEGMEGLVSLRSLDLSETRKLEGIRVGLLSSLSCLEELRLQGSGLCTMDSPMMANYLMEMRSLTRLAILTLSVVGYGDHLDTIVYLQEQNLKIFSVNVYGSTDDYIEYVEKM